MQGTVKYQARSFELRTELSSFQKWTSRWLDADQTSDSLGQIFQDLLQSETRTPFWDTLFLSSYSLVINPGLLMLRKI